MANGCQDVTVGTGNIFVNTRDIGYLKNDVNFQYNLDVLQLYVGSPQVLVCQQVNKLTSSLTAQFAQINGSNLAAALGQLPLILQTSGVVTVNSGDADIRTFQQDVVTGNWWLRVGPGYGLANSYTTLVVKSADGVTTFVVTTDYTFDPVAGVVTWVPGGAITQGESVLLTYGYTTVKGELIKLGANFTLNEVEVTFIHKRPQGGKRIWIYIPRATVQAKINLKFQEKDWVLEDIKFDALDASDLYPTAPFGWVFNETL